MSTVRVARSVDSAVGLFPESALRTGVRGADLTTLQCGHVNLEPPIADTSPRGWDQSFSGGTATLACTDTIRRPVVWIQAELRRCCHNVPCNKHHLRSFAGHGLGRI